MNSCGVAVILPAAGTGERMGIDTPKQYIPIFDKPIICYTVEAFLRIPWVSKVVVLAAPDRVEHMSKILNLVPSTAKHRIHVVVGANTRHRTIFSGLKYLKKWDDLNKGVVVIHDGVRPFITEDVLSKVVTAAQEHGASGIICPLVSTVIAVDENTFLDHSLDRTKFRASEMPQAFQYALIANAYAKSSEYDLDYGTECLHLVHKYMNVKAKMIAGTSDLWKITHKKDVYAATGFIKENQAVGIIGGSKCEGLFDILKKCLCKKFTKVESLTELDEPFPPNNVIIHTDSNISNIIDNGKYYKALNYNKQVAVVHISLKGVDTEENILPLQKKAKSLADSKKLSGLLSYYIVTDTDSTPGLYENIADTVTSLLFNCNTHISGQLFFL